MGGNINEHIKTLNTAMLKESMVKGGCGRMPDIMSVSMQNKLYSS